MCKAGCYTSEQAGEKEARHGSWDAKQQQRPASSCTCRKALRRRRETHSRHAQAHRYNPCQSPTAVLHQKCPARPNGVLASQGFSLRQNTGTSDTAFEKRSATYHQLRPLERPDERPPLAPAQPPVKYWHSPGIQPGLLSINRWPIAIWGAHAVKGRIRCWCYLRRTICDAHVLA